MRNPPGDWKVKHAGMRIFQFSLFILFLSSLVIHADIGVDIDTRRTEFLLYESIDLQVKIRNSSSQPLDMIRMGGKNWLEMIVTSSKGEEISRTSRPWIAPPLLVPGGEIKSVPINLTPIFLIRESDDYKISAKVVLGDQEYISRPLRITVTRGQPIWQQRYTAAPDPEDPEKKERPRVYSLIIHNTSENQILYLRIIDPASSRVYCTTSLGSVVNYQDPNHRIDLKGDLTFSISQAREFLLIAILAPREK
jgi:hypothetical protein